MMRAILIGVALIATSAQAADVRVYAVDAHNNVQYHKPSLTIRADGRVIETDKSGNKLYHRQQYQIAGDKIVPVSAFGYRQYSKPALVIESRNTNSR